MHPLQMYIPNIILQTSLANSTYHFYAQYPATQLGTLCVFVVVVEAPNMLYKWDLLNVLSTPLMLVCPFFWQSINGTQGWEITDLSSTTCSPATPWSELWKVNIPLGVLVHQSTKWEGWAKWSLSPHPSLTFWNFKNLGMKWNCALLLLLAEY